MNNFKGEARRTFKSLIRMANNTHELISAHQTVCVYFGVKCESADEMLIEYKPKVNQSMAHQELVSILECFIDQWELHI